MKKTVEYEVPARTIVRPAQTKSKTVISCDICGKDVDQSRDNHYGSGGHNCPLCGRDICRRQGCYMYEDTYGDSPSRYCIKCFNLRFKKYLQEYYDMVERHEKEEEEFEKRIGEESLKLDIT